MLWLITALIVFMLIAALVAVEASDLLGSVIAVGAAGFALSVIDLLVGAPDLAITQVVVEVVALAMLIRVVLTRRDTSSTVPGDVLRTGAILLAAGLILAGAYLAIVPGRPGTLPKFGEPLMAHPTENVPAGVGADYVARAAEETGAANVVTSVLLDYRAYDTLGEATVIFVSILGVYAILRPIGRKRHGAPASEETA